MERSKPKVPKIPEKGIKIKINLVRVGIALLIFLTLAPFVLAFFQTQIDEGETPLSQSLEDIRKNNIDKVVIEGDKITFSYKDGTVKTSTKESNISFTEILDRAHIDPSQVNYAIADQTIAKAVGDIAGIVIPLLLTGAVIYFIFRSQSRGAQDIFSFGRSKAKLFAKGKQSTTFKDVAGVDEAKKELEEIVDFLKHPAKYRAMGARTPKGVLLFGPAGVGKTLLARASAGEAGVPFFSMAGSEFMEMLVGVGASRVRDLFANAKAAAPSIIFIDEVDAIGRQRGRSGFVGGHDEREQTLNQILVEMDGFTPNDNVIVMAASVVGDTPVVIKQDGEAKLVEIGKYIDQFYPSGEVEGEIQIGGVESLGFDKKISTGNLTHKSIYFSNSAFKKVGSVFRHKVDEIYQIEYLGGIIRATGNHSVFVRSLKGIEPKAVSKLEKGDVLIDIPFKTNRTNKNLREIKAHKFDEAFYERLPIFDPEIEFEWQAKYQYAMAAYIAGDSQEKIGKKLTTSQGTVGNWLEGKHTPRSISRKIGHGTNLEEVVITPELCRLLGYYTAEGYSRWELDFCFNVKEKDLILDVVGLMQNIFGLTPKLHKATENAVNITYQNAAISHFFARLCGKGAHNKHIPPFLFEAPYPYFKEYLRGWWEGDGYEDSRGKGEVTTVSKQLAMEINWIAHMHGVKTYIGGFTAKEGRQISGGKPLKSVKAWRVGWGKGANPFNVYEMQRNSSSKSAVVKKVTKLPFNGYVYDLCGVENEAFFGGASPVLLHNTNRGDLLDPALLRPGRFDRRITLDMPDKDGRKEILQIHARGKKMGKSINWDRVADRTVGFSGADLENMLNEAAIAAARENKKEVDMEDIEESATKVKMGPARRRLQSEEDRKITAYHEAGHAIVTRNLPNMDPVHRISIVARGMSLGHTLIPPAADRTHETKSRFLAQLAAMMGGRAAEELVFSDITAGASNDIENATRLARAMVTDFGMSDLGPINMGQQTGYDDFGNVNWTESSPVSSALAEKIDLEVKKLMDTAHKLATSLVKKERKSLDKVALALLKDETLDRDQFEKIVGKK